MPRPKQFRKIGCRPQSCYYKPQGIPMAMLQQVDLSLDEFEAIRLADLQGLYQADAAEKMNVSRQTFGRILDSAHKKIAEALVEGKALAIQSPPSTQSPPRQSPVKQPQEFYGRGRGRHGNGQGCRGRGRRRSF